MKNQKIIFTHLKPDIWQYKVASVLRKKDFKTISISLLDFDRKMFNKAFDEILCLNLKDLKLKTIFLKLLKSPLEFLKFFSKLLTIKVDIAICQGAPHYLAAIFIRLFKNRFPRVYFSHDIEVSRYKTLEKFKRFSEERERWGEKYSFYFTSIYFRSYPTSFCKCYSVISYISCCQSSSLPCSRGNCTNTRYTCLICY